MGKKAVLLAAIGISFITFPGSPDACALDDRKDTKVKESKSSGADAPCLSWIDRSVTPWAVLLCVHGLGLHNGTYEPLGKRLSPLGIATYAIDVRGFGSWMKADGREQVNFDGCFSDIEGALKAVRKAHPGLPVFLLGESMGGAIALQTAARYPTLIDGVVSSVPGSDRFQQKKTDLAIAFRLFSAPNKDFDIGTKIVNQATEKATLRSDWGGDPLARMKISPKELVQFQKFMNNTHDIAGDIKTTPVLIVQGVKDKLVKPEGTIELFNELATDDKDLVMVGNAEHLIYEEGQFNDHVVDVTISWIDKHCSKAVQTARMPLQAAASRTQPRDPSLKPPGPREFVPNNQTARFDQFGLPQMSGRGGRRMRRPMRQGAPQRFRDQLVTSSGESTPRQNITRKQMMGGPGRAVMTHLQLARTYLRLEDPLRAKEHFRKAIRIARNSGIASDAKIAQEANRLLLTLPAKYLAPRLGPETRTIATQFHVVPESKSSSEGKPSVLCFYADWSEPCKQIEPLIVTARSIYGDKVNFVNINAEDPKNEELLDQYQISPLPTVLFLNSSNEVAAYEVGFSGPSGIMDGIKKVLHAQDQQKSPPAKPDAPPGPA